MITDGWLWVEYSWGITIAVLVVYAIVLETRLAAVRKEQG